MLSFAVLIPRPPETSAIRWHISTGSRPLPSAFESRIQPGILIHCVPDDVCEARVGRRLLTCDVVFCCTDSKATRDISNQMAYQHWLPALALGVRISTSAGHPHPLCTGRCLRGTCG